MPQSEIGNPRSFQLQLELVCDEGDEFGIRGFSLGIGNSIPKESLKGIQVASVPGYFDGVPDSTLYSGRGGLEGLGHLGVQYFRDGIGVPYGPPGSLAGCSRISLQIKSLNVGDLLLSLSSRLLLLYGFENMIAKPNRKVKREPNKHFKKFFCGIYRTILGKNGTKYSIVIISDNF